MGEGEEDIEQVASEGAAKEEAALTPPDAEDDEDGAGASPSPDPPSRGIVSDLSDRNRPNHLMGLIRAQRSSMREMGAGVAAGAADLSAVAEGEEEEEEEEDVERQVTLSDSTSARFRESQAVFEETVRRVADLTRRFSVLKIRPERLVEVRLKNVTYHVPLKLDAPAIRTVWNQSAFYVAYEVFKRLHLYCRGPKKLKAKRDAAAADSQTGNGQADEDVDADNASTDGEFVPKTLQGVWDPHKKIPILRNISLVLKPGNCYLILGPPGSGKTTLLKTIAGMVKDESHKIIREGEPYRNRPHMEGRVEYNGVTAREDPDVIIPNLVSYVQQHDLHAPRLTVKETFDFAFQCSTGGNHTNIGVSDSADAKKFDNEKYTENLTIEGLDLAHVGETFVGNDDIRGVSGGQRRRVTVGEMMQSQNPVACADEISTGLDAAATFDIIRSMVCFAKAAKTTRIVSLLQPGPETFTLFDEVIVLAEGGRVIYAGPIEEVVDYFAGLGYKLPATMDVADFLNMLSTPDAADLFEPPEGAEGDDAVHYSPQRFADKFLESEQGKRILEALESPYLMKWKPAASAVAAEDAAEKGDQLHGGDVPQEYYVEFHNSFGRSLSLNFKRHLTLWKRDMGFIIGKSAENLGMAVATGGILFGQANIDIGQDISQQNSEKAYKLMSAVYGALFMCVFHILQGTMTSCPDELDGRGIHYKHADANFYQSLSFAIGRLVSTFPQRCIDICAFGIPVYWMVGLVANAGAFFTYLALLLMMIISLKVFFGIIAAILPSKANVQGVGSFIVLMWVLFGGFIIYQDVIPNYYWWVMYSNPCYWAYQALLINEFTTGSKYDRGDLFLLARGFETDRAWIGYAFVFLVPFTVGSTLVLALALKYKRFEPTRAISKHKDDDDESKEDAEKLIDLPFTPVDLTFEDVCYEVKASTGDEMLKLLNNINGSFRAGRMCALMGSSGAGKTTLMDVVAMRKTSGVITGEIRLNGFPQDRISFLRCSGYVEQFDIQAPELTVLETVKFSARLRLSSEVEETKDDKGKLAFVRSVLEMLELTSIQDQQVGSYEAGGLTFEQRKRLAIAVELAGSPSVIFLDEPTSGLDSRAAVLVMRSMKRIADTGRTICATIHQPSAAVFEMFDDLLLLKTGGKVVFFGELGDKSVELTHYFESRGADPIEYGENPASWMLKAAYTGDEDWSEIYKASDQHSSLIEQINAGKESPDKEREISYDSEYATNWKFRLKLMLARINTIYMRSPSYNLTRLVISLFYAFILGSPFLRNSYRDAVWTENEVDGILGTMFFSLIVLGVTSITMVVPVMKTIRDVFYKHRASGMIEHSPVAFSMAVGELPYLALISVLFCIVYYATIGLFDNVAKFFQFWLFSGLSLATYSYLGQGFMCIVKDIPTAGALMGALIGYNVFFSGFIVKPQYFVGPFQMGYWTAPGRFAFEGIVVSQFDDNDLTVEAQLYSPFYFYLDCETTPCTGTMEEYVNFSFGGRFSTDHFGLDVGVLIGYVGLAWLLTFFGMRKFNYVNT